MNSPTPTNYQTTFKSNKYTRWYLSILETHQVTIGGEKHHIVPKSCGGSNSKDNIRRISTRAHLVCHLLLTKMMLDPNHHRAMIYAARLLLVTRPSKNTRLSSAIREAHREIQSVVMKGKVSPLSNPEVMKKSHSTRRANGTNPFVSSNPMKNDVMKRKKVEATSGDRHFMKTRRSYVHLDTHECRYFESAPNDRWIEQSHLKGKITKAKGLPKPKFPCNECQQLIPKHRMKAHNKAKHENSKD